MNANGFREASMSLLEIVVDGEQAAVEAALSGGADVNGVDETVVTAPHRSASLGETAILYAVLVAGAT